MKTKAIKVKPVPLALDDPHFAAHLQRMHELMRSFQGSLPDLESAVGFMFLGYYYGWKPLQIIHSKKTVNKYEQILGIDIKSEFAEVGPYAQKSNGYRMFEGVSSFWKAINGEVALREDEGDRKYAT